MRQLTKELKHILNTGYNMDDNEYYIEYGYSTFSNKYVCNIYDGDLTICKIKYKKHDGITEKNIFERYTDDKQLKNTIRQARYRYA